jgi:hypothetical protein
MTLLTHFSEKETFEHRVFRKDWAVVLREKSSSQLLSLTIQCHVFKKSGVLNKKTGNISLRHPSNICAAAFALSLPFLSVCVSWTVYEPTTTKENLQD